MLKSSASALDFFCSVAATLLICKAAANESTTYLPEPLEVGK
jgi:hypothetical protein